MTNTIDRYIKSETSPILKSHSLTLDLIQYKYLAVKIKSTQYSLRYVFEMFHEYEQVLFCQEDASDCGRHFHGFIRLAVDDDVGSQCRKFKDKFKELYPQLNNKFAFAVSPVKKIEYISYVLKDGLFLYKGISDEIIEDMYSQSYKKYDKVTFAKEFDKIYYDKKFTPKEVMTKYCELKQQYRQKITIKQYQDLYLNLLLKDKEKLREFENAQQHKVEYSFLF